MSKVMGTLFAASVVVCLAVSEMALCGEAPSSKPAITVRKLDAQVVLYTVSRGPYDKAGPAIGKLFALAGQKGIVPQGSMAMAYLNNPQLTSSAHYLVEIRVPVSKDALKLAGTLGEFTDVKELPAMEVAVITKDAGVTDVGGLFDQLTKWIRAQGYIGADTPYEVYLTNTMSGDYAQMKTEIMAPVAKIGEQK
jgi:effector-binding domain-containing protein